ncbi:hypothetical protein [Hydrogenothermus marinus]|uniref:Uncharacterized protein n=1 Tax=Hydrogenothermus marinus TaxID=133270 RepID=A0A3M0BR76_9AQUI|nr:hypothetical protein [Hydrogenothermus marinus]RMA97338.1 hypothetical protein CLV39_0998 [Hydrogenothermus marinus]
MRINGDFKVFHLLEEYPDSEEIVKRYFSFFYEEEIEDIALKRLSIDGAFNVINAEEKIRKQFFKDLHDKLGLDISKSLLEE